MNVKVFNDPITILQKNHSSYRNNYYNKVGLVVEDYERLGGGLKTFSSEGCLGTLDADLQDSSLGPW
jgi:hypothetical protein